MSFDDILLDSVGNLNEILNTSANFERQQLDSLRKSINHLDCYLKENSSQERISLKKRVIPQTNKMLKSIESQIEMQTNRNEIKREKTSKHRKYKKSLIAKSSQNDAKKKEKERKKSVFLNLMNTPGTQTFFPLLFSVYLRTGVLSN